jgi:hypothetical protein
METNTTYDVVIENGRVMDPETNLDAVRNVGIRDGKIVAITEDKLTGTKVIDAIPFGQKLALRDGITSPMELEVGVYPVKEWYDSLEGKSITVS